MTSNYHETNLKKKNLNYKLIYGRYAFATNYTSEERHTILDAMNNLAELVNSGSDGQKCISYTPYDPEKDKGTKSEVEIFQEICQN